MKALASWTLSTPIEALPISMETHGKDEVVDITAKVHLTTFSSSGSSSPNFQGGVGLSHALGHALDSRTVYLVGSFRLDCKIYPPDLGNSSSLR